MGGAEGSKMSQRETRKQNNRHFYDVLKCRFMIQVLEYLKFKKLCHVTQSIGPRLMSSALGKKRFDGFERHCQSFPPIDDVAGGSYISRMRAHFYIVLVHEFIYLIYLETLLRRNFPFSEFSSNVTSDKSCLKTARISRIEP